MWHEFPSHFETRRGGQNVLAAQPFNNIFKTPRHIYATRWRSLTCLHAYITCTHACMYACSHEHACPCPCSKRFIRAHGGHCLLMHCITCEIIAESLLGAVFTRCDLPRALASLVYFIVNYLTSLCRPQTIMLIGTLLIK